MAQTIAQKISEVKYVEELRRRDPGAFKLENFIVNGSELREEIYCAAAMCKLRQKYPGLRKNHGKGEQQSVFIEGTMHLVPRNEFFVFCYACHRVSHAYCEDIEASEALGKTLERPQLCSGCEAAPENAKAVEFAAEPENWQKTVLERANSLRKPGEKIPEIPIQNLSEEQLIPLIELQTSLNRTRIEKSIQDGLLSLSKITMRRKNKVSGNEHPPMDEIESIESEEENDEESNKQMKTHQSSTPTYTLRVTSNKRKSYVENLSVSELSPRDCILLEQAEVQKEANEKAELNITRRALKPIPKFNGSASKYIEFLRGVERFRDLGKYNCEALKQYVFSALEGDAYDVISPCVDNMSVEEVMSKLARLYGRPTALIQSAKRPLESLAFSDPYTQREVRQALTAIDNYYRTCKFAMKQPLEEEELGRQLLKKLSGSQRLQFKEKFTNETTKLSDFEKYFERLYTILSSIEEEAETTAPRQINSLSTMSTHYSDSGANTAGRFDMYAVRGRGNRNFGYDMEAVNRLTKGCEFCNSSSHFSVECYKYKNTPSGQKFQFVQEKNLCRCCVLVTSHQAKDCKLRNGCGYVKGSDECGRNHHITLHNAYEKRNSYGTTKSFGGGNNKNNRFRGNRNNNNHRNNSSSSGSHNNTNDNGPSTSAGPSGQQKGTENKNKDREAAANGSFTPGGSVSSAKIEAMKQLLNNATSSTVYSISMQEAKSEFESNLIGPVQAMPISQSNVSRTVKVFKTIFIGDASNAEGFAVGDSGAEVSLMSESLRQKLSIKGEKEILTMTFANGSSSTIQATKVTLRVRGVHAKAPMLVLRNVYAVPDLKLPPRSLNVELLKEKYPHLRTIPYDSYNQAVPDLLIGSPHASIFESQGKLYEGAVGQPVGLRAKLGYCIYGGCPEGNGMPSKVLTIKCEEKEEMVTNEELTDVLCKMNAIDSLGIRETKDQFTEDELKALAIINEELKIRDDGTVEIPLIWNRIEGVIPKVPNNKAMVFRRQIAHEAKLNKTPGYVEEFNKNFEELLERGYVREATREDMSTHGNISFLPMSLVVNANKNPPKFRNVFDASAKFEGKSLNSFLLKGPDLLINQLSPLLRMRMDSVAFMGDVEQMFMRIKICDRDALCQCVLWRDPRDGIMRTYVVTSMLFGPTCSPFASQHVKNVIARQWADYWPEAARLVQENCYMDDLGTSASSPQVASQLCSQAILIFESMNMRLRNIQSNSKAFLATLPPEYVSKEGMLLLEGEEAPNVSKVLGCIWDTLIDSYGFVFDKNLYLRLVRESEHHPTKRDQCSTLARIYDIFGFLTPLTIRGKILLQQTWLKNIDWDEQVDDESFIKWKNWVHEISNAAQIKVQRQFVRGANLSLIGKAELHTFMDAGTEAFAAVSYLVLEHNGDRSSMIVLARAKVTPIRLRTKSRVTEMPRLELYACLIAVRLASVIMLMLNGTKFTRYYWSDSQVALSWILNPNHKLIKYAIAPVEEILEKTNRNEWRYVPSKLNVADLATKFSKMDFGDSFSKWFTGPEFLLKPQTEWPEQKKIFKEDYDRQTEFEEQQEGIDKFGDRVLTLAVSVQEQFDNNNFRSFRLPINGSIIDDKCIDLLSGTTRSRYNKFLRAVARALKVFECYTTFVMKQVIMRSSKKQKHKNEILKELNLNEVPTKLNDANVMAWKQKTKFNELTVEDLMRAQMFIIRREQKIWYTEDYDRLKENLPVKDENLKKLNVWMDREEIIRINSRVKLGVDFPQAFLPVLPRKSVFVTLLLEQVHFDYRHAHLETQIAHVRTIIWVPQLRSALQATKFHCNFCKIKYALPYIPPMGDLPRERVDANVPPFYYTAIDCFGPITVRMFGREKKIWVAIFTCARTRFVHLHLLEDMSTECILEAITVMWAAHGPVSEFWTDNGTNFQGAARKLRELDQAIKRRMLETRDALTPKLNEKRCTWKFFPAYSPWMAGLVERLVGITKQATYETLHDRKVTRRALNIALHEAAHRINNRPLTHNAVEAEDAPALTPHVLAKGRSGFPTLRAFPAEAIKNAHYNDRSHFIMGQRIAHEITRRFNNYYLPILTRRTKWTKETNSPIKIGDLVLMIEPNDTRQEWKRARVIKLHTGRDGRGRVADVIMPDGKVKKSRSIQRLAKVDLQPSLVNETKKD